MNFVDPTGMIWVRSGSDTFWFTDEEWETKSKEVDANGNPRYRPLKESEFEYDSVDGRVRLDPNGPSAENPNGWTIIGPNIGSGAAPLMATAAVVSQLDGPEPFVADVVAVGILAYAGYAYLSHESLNTPTATVVTMADNNKQIKKVVEGLTTAAERELEKLRYDPPIGGARNHHKKEIKAMLEKARAKAGKLVGKAAEEAVKKIEEIEKAVKEIAPDN